MSEGDEIVSYRCANCRCRVSGDPPRACPVCHAERFEAYHPFAFSGRRLLAAAAVCCVYLIVTRTILVVYDPISLVIEGFREGDPSAGMIGVFLCGLLVPGMLCGLIYPRVFLYVISLISCVLWAAFCVCLRASESC
jgi:hypothetical protein